MNRLFRVATLAAAAWAASGPAQAQTRVDSPNAFALNTDDPNAARIGVYLGENSLRDTLGVLVNSVMGDSPAAKAGIKEGDRIQSIAGVNLKMTRDDAGDDALSGMMSRRLIRELDKLKAGDEVELQVYSGGSSRSVRLKTVASRELAAAPSSASRTRPMLQEFRNDRAALGLNVGGPVTKRDTLGVFVMSVTPDGPAEKAGIVEGDRIAKINSTDLRVPAPEAGDADLSRARARRLNQEISNLAAGDAVTLTVVSGGRQREVRLNAVKASELHDGDGYSFFFGDGAFSFPHNFRINPRLEFQNIPRFEFHQGPRGGSFFFDGGRIRADVREQIDRALQEAGRSFDRGEVREHIDRAMDEARKSIERARINGTYYRGDEIPDDVREKVERAMEKARDAVEKAHEKVTAKRGGIKTQ
jgi:hypothetical protein